MIAAVVIRDMIDPATGVEFKRVFVTMLDSLDDLTDLVTEIEERFPRESVRHD